MTPMQQIKPEQLFLTTITRRNTDSWMTLRSINSPKDTAARIFQLSTIQESL